MEQVMADRIYEILQRTRRTETRLTRLCMHMNADAMGAKPPILLCGNPKGGLWLDLPGLDVGVGECLQFARDKGILGDISLFHNGKHIGTITVVEGI